MILMSFVFIYLSSYCVNILKAYTQYIKHKCFNYVCKIWRYKRKEQRQQWAVQSLSLQYYTRKALMLSIKGRPSKKCSRWRWTSRYMMTRYILINFSMVNWFLPELYITDERHCSLLSLIGMLEIRILLISLWPWLLIATDIHVYNHL
jgi:hypothetical protein